MTTRECAEFLGCSQSHIRNLITSNRIAARRVPTLTQDSYYWDIPPDELQRYEATHSKRGYPRGRKRGDRPKYPLLAPLVHEKGVQVTVWMVRAGRYGEQEQEALNGNFVTIHWTELPHLSDIQDKETLREVYDRVSKEPAKTRANAVGQVWAFCKTIKLGDLVVLPLHDQEHPKAPPKEFMIGKVTGPYCYRTDMGQEITHTRGVKWIGRRVPATAFPPDILLSLRCPQTVYSIGVEDAKAQIRAVLSGQKNPGQKRPRNPNNTGLRIHPWDDWLSLRSNQKVKKLRLVRGVHYEGMNYTMGIQFRQRATKRGLKVSLRTDEQGITLEISRKKPE